MTPLPDKYTLTAMTALEFIDAVLRTLENVLTPDEQEKQVTVRNGTTTHRLTIDHALARARDATDTLESFINRTATR